MAWEAPWDLGWVMRLLNLFRPAGMSGLLPAEAFSRTSFTLPWAITLTPPVERRPRGRATPAVPRGAFNVADMIEIEIAKKMTRSRRLLGLGVLAIYVYLPRAPLPHSITITEP
jgi:hypothetical protein